MKRTKPEGYEETRRVIKEYLGEVVSLPMIFDPQCLCPECLWLGMKVHGNMWECPQCHFYCRATVVVDHTGLKWLNLLATISGDKGDKKERE